MPTSPVIERLKRAWNAHDVAAILALYAEDSEVHRPSLPEPLRGRAALRECVEEFLHAFPDVTFEVRSALESDREAAALVTLSGTHSGDLMLLNGQTIPATDAPLSYEVALFQRLDESGRIRFEKGLFDVDDFLRQLGIVAVPLNEPTAPQASPLTR